ncbi:histidine protein methyltransferase 1 homolog [Cylas formicarius]|uniref:histidine protein methyltransferase 1 homolog n=1 Tax=Cylas formicarius TaxID=197179 RepID=UPI0029587DAC|nr:histidine protein methyltransferase 1 homolog [Cylas formicarius]
MFKFNFSDRDVSLDLPASLVKQGSVVPLPSKRINPEEIDDSIRSIIFSDCQVNIYRQGEHAVRYFSCEDILRVLRTHGVSLPSLEADDDHSDLKSGIYEGGLKIWECTYDLISYMVVDDIDMKNKCVLDLGCGAGLVGLWCLLRGAACTFQDYNSDVVCNLTIPNVLLNDGVILEKCAFFSGDWQSFTELSERLNLTNSFDYIMTSETIYNVENYPKLHSVFEKMLKRTGQVYLAAKVHYFGVGGGLSLFEDYVRTKNVFKTSLSWQSVQGVNRMILNISFK